MRQSLVLPALMTILWTLLTATAFADSWAFESQKKVEVFGDSRIELTTDASSNARYPDFVLDIYHRDQLQAKYRGIRFSQLFASPDHTRFMGLSNIGVPGTALVLFGQYGNLLVEVKHGIARFDYCEEGLTFQRVWYDADHPQVSFVVDPQTGGYQSITLRDCHGETITLIDTILQAHQSALLDRQEHLARMKLGK